VKELDTSAMPDGSPTEREEFEKYREILSREDLTLEDVKEFCASQIAIIEVKWKDYNLENSKKAELIPYYTVYKAILSAIDGPKVAREAAERQLIELTK